MKRVVVIGSGMAGLGAAVSLRRAGHEVVLLERSSRPGGLSHSYRKDGYTYSIGPHFLESSLADKVPGLREQCFETEYVEEIHYDGRLHRFPTGLLRRPEMVLGVALATLRKTFQPHGPRSLAEYVRHHYGAGFGQGVLEPLLEKWAGRPSMEVSIDVAKRLDPPSLKVFLHHVRVLLERRSRHLDPGRGVWMYPREGTQAISAGIVASAGLDVRVDSPVERVQVEGDRVVGLETGGHAFEADAVVATTPISSLWRLVQGTSAFDRYRSLRFRPLILVFLRLALPRLTRYQWVWFPERRFSFYRISESKNIHASFAPASSTMLTLEVPCETTDPIWSEPDDAIGRRVFDELRTAYPMPDSAYLGVEVMRIPAVYPVFLVETERLHREIDHQSPVRNLFLAGRFGLFRYLMMEESYDSGVACAGAMRGALA